MSASDIVNVSISLSAPVVSRAGFKTPLFLSGEAEAGNKFSGLVASYRNPGELAAAGFSTSGATYRAATLWFSQVPNGGRFKVGKRATSEGFKFGGDFTFAAGPVGTEYWIEVDGVRYTHTLSGVETMNAAASAIAALIHALADYTATATGATIAFDSVVDALVPYVRFSSNISWADTTTTATTTTVDDLNAIRAADPDWYALFSDVQSASEIAKISAWAETQVVHFGATVADDACFSSGSTTDAMAENKAAARANTMLDFGWPGDFGIVGAYSRSLAKTPGTTNWAHKTIKGRTPREITNAQQDVIEGKRGNHYVTANGAATFLYGMVGDGEFVDTINFLHYSRARIAEALIAKFRAEERIDYTQAGINALGAVVEGELARYVGAGLSTDAFPVVEVPSVLEIPADVRRSRVLTSDYPIRFRGLLSGAINQATVEGVYTYDPASFVSAG